MATGKIIGIAFDTTAGKFWPAVNNAYSGAPAAGTGGFALPTGALQVMAYSRNGSTMTFRPDAPSQTYAAPSGFTAIGP